MIANVQDLFVGTKFKYNEMFYEVTDTSDRPFIECKCLTEPNNYEGLGIIFGGGAEIVEVADGTPLYQLKFKIYKNRRH